MNNDRAILGIDPDVEKSGFALLNCATHTFDYLAALSFTDAIRFLGRLAANEKYKGVLIVIEDSDMSVNWHYKPSDKPGVIAAKGRSIGLCHATYRHLKEYAEELGFEVKAKKPLKKMWHGTDGKISHNELKVFVSGLPARTNPEIRDAIMLAWDEAGFPIRISVRK